MVFNTIGLIIQVIKFKTLIIITVQFIWYEISFKGSKLFSYILFIFFNLLQCSKENTIDFDLHFSDWSCMVQISLVDLQWSCIHNMLCNQYILNTYFVLRMVLHAGDWTLNRMDLVPTLEELSDTFKANWE